MDTIIKNGMDDKVIDQIKNYRENGGSGIFSCNLIQAEKYSYFTSDGSVFKLFISPPAPLDDLFYKALNIK